MKADLPKSPPVTPVAQALMTVVGSLFDDAFSVTRLYSIDDMVVSK
jgi:hypothetical protein